MKDELNVVRVANGVIDSALCYKYRSKKEDCRASHRNPRVGAHGDKSAGPSAPVAGSSRASERESQRDGEDACGRLTPPPAPPSLANYQGHEIYEIDEDLDLADGNSSADLEDISFTGAIQSDDDDELEEGEIREDDDLEEGELRKD